MLESSYNGGIVLQPPHGIDKKESRAIRQKIRVVLMEDWDPIGVNGIPEAADEYDNYIGDFYEMLAGRRSRQEIISRLEYLEGEHMGLPHLRHELPGKLEAVADALLSIPFPK
jgi:hypothetical protein